MDGLLKTLPEGSPEVLAGEMDNVKVAVRCRPLSTQEIAQGHSSAITVDEYNCTVEVKNPANKNEPPKMFTFDEVFGPDSQQMTIYNKVARPIVENVLKGYYGTIFAYGQTGTGKTFTMSGEMDQPTMRGIIPNSFVHICDHISKSQSDKRFIVRVSYLEIYNEEIRDLLSKDKDKKKNIDIRESPEIGVFVQNLSSVTVDTAEAMYNLMKFGSDNRQVGSTNMNENSSRSHAVFTVTVECSAGVGTEQHVTQGKLHLVDLAGSERQSKTGATGERLKEASKINLSLSTLGRVISALVDKNGKTHIPYRVSKLTRLLQDSLGGNSKTVMIANIGPASYNYDETISTLRYANRAKDIKNIARINEDPKDALMRKYLEEINELKKRLENDEAVSGGESEEDGNVLASNTKPIPMNYHFEEKIREMENELNAKKQQLDQERGLAETEKLQLAEEILLKEEEIQKSKNEHQRLAERLAAIEKKVIVGGENMLEKAEKQAQLLEKSNRDLERVRTNENELRKRLETRQAEHLDIEEKYTSLQEEAAGKTRKLKKVWSSYMQAKAELADMDAEHQREMEGLLDNVRQLQHKLKLYSTVVNSYVPLEYLKLVEKHAYWNEDIGDWQLKCIAYTGNNMREVKLAPSMMCRNGNLQLKQPYLSYADILEQPAVPQQIANANRNVFRPKSAKKDRNAARIKALLE